MHTRTLKCNSWAEILVVFQLSDIITKRILGFENNIFLSHFFTFRVYVNKKFCIYFLS